jgi:hypothetical protein
VSDLLEAASTALGTPRELVQRSAAARAAADGTSVEDILAAWAGDAPPPSPAAAETEAEAPEPEPEPETEAAPEPAPAPAPVMEQAPPTPAEPAVEYEPEPEPVLEPVALATRVKTAVRIGAWTGAALGVVGFLVSSAFWAPNTTALPDSGSPVVQISPNSVLLAIALVSVVFGAIVAGMSRVATAWTNPAMQLSSSRAATAWIGAALGLALGVVGGALLNGFGAPVEGSEPALIQLPVLATLFVMIIGGAILGALTALVPQVLGVPVAVDDDDVEEVHTVKTRLRNAVSIPVAGLLLLVILVLPFAFALIESNHFAPGAGGAIVAIIAAGGVLGFSALAGSRPEMRISFGDLMVAVIGIGVVLLIIISVLFATQRDEHAEEAPQDEAAVVQIV